MTDNLKRRIGPWLLTAYGVGVMVGAGIYVLIGAVVAEAGIYAPLAFLLAGLVAAPSAISYAELSTRIPEAAGESAYVDKGLGLHWLAVAIGLAIVLAGIVSAAAVLRGGVGYLLAVLDVPLEIAILVLGSALVLVALVGVLESLALAAIFTVVEVCGLLLVVWAGFTAPPVTDWSAPPDLVLTGVAAAAALAFFAFIGFEDIVNMAEEVKRPEFTMPRAILWALAITTFLYILVAFATVRAVPASDLAASNRPLVMVWQAGRSESAAFLSLIAVVAALNGVLAQMVMAARVLFGLGRREARLAVFHHAHSRLGTPVLATISVGFAVLAASLSLPVSALAEVTSIVLLTVFCIVNISLIALKKKEPDAPFCAPVFVPWLGLVAALVALLAALADLI
ncbi:MAG: amino acid permease [Alphaproteobacteria bacterium]|nr:amino acid permease [Alphaproteobacteria bacterium]